MTTEISTDYPYRSAEGDHTRFYLWDPVARLLQSEGKKRVFELGCGNGAFARHLTGFGFEMTGVDPSLAGISHAMKAEPKLPLEIGSAYDPLAEKYGTFPLLVSLEVIAHVYYPKKFAQTVYDLLEPGGVAVISTPYHGYLKNLAVALSGKMDTHFNPLWDHGIIKIWSVPTITRLFDWAGLQRENVLRIGRIPVLAKAMVLAFRKPLGPKD